MTSANPPAGGLRPVLGFWEVVASGIGIIVGAGIYILIGNATRDAGGAVWLSFLLAAALSGFTAISYCELAATFPRAAAEYEYARHAFPNWVAFTVGWVMISGLVVAAAAVSLGFGQYLQQFFPIETRVSALALLAVVAAVAIAGIKFSARLTLALSAVQVGGLLVVIALGSSHITHFDATSSAGPSGVLAGAALVFFAFIGFDEVITLSEETRDASRVIPRALLTALGVSALLYVLVAVVSVSTLGPDALAASPRPLADVIAHVTGGPAADFVAAIALASTLNATLLALTAGSRLMYGMASSGALPSALGRVYGRGVAPVPAVAVCALVAAGFALFGQLGTVAAVTDFAVYLVFIAVNATVILLRFTQPGLTRPFRSTPAILRVPVPPAIGLGVTLLMLTQLDSSSIAIGSLVVLLGLLVSATLSRGPRRRAVPPTV